MQKISKRVLDVKVTGRWLTSCLVDLGELSLHANWYFLGPRAVHLSSIFLVNAIIRNRNSTGAMLSPFFTLTLKSMDVSIFPMMILTTILSYVYFIYDHSLGGELHFTIMSMSSAWLDTPKDLNMSANDTHVGRFWFCLM